MTKKSYQKRLPTVLPPAPPAPRRSAESDEPTQQTGPAEPLAGPVPVAQPPGPEMEPEPEWEWEPEWESEAVAPWDPEPDPLLESADARPSIGVVVGLVAAGLIGLVLGGLAVAWVVDDARDPPAREPGSAAGLDPPGMLVTDESYAETQVRTNGDVIVRHWIQADEPLRRLRLVLPEVPGAEELSAEGIEVVADGALVNGPATLTGIGATYTFDKTTDVQVRYVLAGAVVRSDSVTGRALALATTLDLRYSPRPARGIRVVIAPEVLSLACSASRDATPVPCGQAESTDQWRVELTGPHVDDRVMAQVTLD